MKACILITWEAGKPTSQVWEKSEAETATAAFRKARSEGKTAQLFLHLGPGDKRCRAPESLTAVVSEPKQTKAKATA